MTARYKKTGKAPQPFLDRPRLKEQDVPYMTAFWDLDLSRQSGMNGPQPIQLSEIVAYLTLEGIASAAVAAKYRRLIQKLDHTFIRHQAERAAKSKT